MTQQSIGAQLDGLGLALDLRPGEQVLEAKVTLITGNDDVEEIHRPIRVPPQQPGSIPVPHPHARLIRTISGEDQELTGEQRKRIVAWLTANGIDTSLVASGPVTVECKTDGEGEWGHMICFTEYYQNAEGERVFDWRTQGALTVPRSVRQSVALDPEPLEGTSD